MPTLLPAGTFVRERDFSETASEIGFTRLAIIGAASRGPLDTPTEFNSESELVRVFGRPLLNDYGLQAAIQYLQGGGTLLYTRVADNTVAAAHVDVTGTGAGTPAVAASGSISFTGSANPADGDTITIRRTVPTLVLENDANGVSGNTILTKTGAVLRVTGMSGGTSTARATGKVEFLGSANPADGDTLTISDGINPAKVFEFDSNSTVSGSNISVTIGPNAYATLAALITAINAAPSLSVSATNGTVSATFEFDNNSTYTPGNVPVLIDSTSALTLAHLITAINNATSLGITAVNGTVTVPQVNLTHQTPGAAGNATVAKVGTNIAVTGLTGGVDAVVGGTATVATVYASTPGTWANSLRVLFQKSKAVNAPANSFDLIVQAPVDDAGTLGVVERFDALNLDTTSPRFAETVLVEGISGEVGPSEYVTIDVLTGAALVAVPGDGSTVSYTLAGGLDGISGLTASRIVGSITGNSSTGLKALANAEKVDFNLLAVPGNTHTDVVSEMLRLCAARGDAFALIDTPFGLSPQQVVDWHNGLSTVANAPTQALDSSYGGVFWSWVQVYDAYNKKKLWLPPSGFVAQAMARSDALAGPWTAPAGPVRGLIDGLALERSPSLDERALLSTGANRVNTFIDSKATGLQLYGNRTLQRRTSALTDIHTRRMLIYAEKLIAASVAYLVFNPNDAATWSKFKLLVSPVLDTIKANHGLEAFDVICDESTNPAAQRQRKTMRGRIRIRAVGAAEVIEVEFNLFAAGATFTE